MVGTTSSRKHLRLQAGADVEAAVRAAADLPPKSGAGPSSSEQSSREAAGAEEPSTQGMDVDSDDGADEPPRPLSPVRMASFEATLCLVCASEETDGSVELACGFYCAECVSNGLAREAMEANATAELAARTAAAAKQPRPERPHLEPRRSERERKLVVSLYDIDKSGKGQPDWSDYERSRAGSQHGRMRDESYSEVQAARDKLRKQVDEAKREHGELAAALDSVYSSLQRLVAPNGLAAARGSRASPKNSPGRT